MLPRRDNTSPTNQVIQKAPNQFCLHLHQTCKYFDNSRPSSSSIALPNTAKLQPVGNLWHRYNGRLFLVTSRRAVFSPQRGHVPKAPGIVSVLRSCHCYSGCLEPHMESKTWRRRSWIDVSWEHWWRCFGQCLLQICLKFLACVKL